MLTFSHVALLLGTFCLVYGQAPLPNSFSNPSQKIASMIANATRDDPALRSSKPLPNSFSDASMKIQSMIANSSDPDIRSTVQIQSLTRKQLPFTIQSQSVVGGGGFAERSAILLGSDSMEMLDSDRRACPCSRPDLCNPISVTPRKEVYGFGVSMDPKVYLKYDWKKLTTLAMWNFTDELMCHAHENNVRLHLVVPDVPHNQLTNATFRQLFIAEHVARVKNGFLDGINFDPEYPVAINSPERQAMVDLVNETRIALNLQVPGSWVVFDAAWAVSYCVDERCYDYKGLSEVVDFFFVMAYCIQGQIWGPCVAMSNAPFFKMVDGIHGFFNLSIPPSKLVLGLPWFGYDYPCVNVSSDTNICQLPHGEYNGAPCSDWVGNQLGIDEIFGMLKNVSLNTSIHHIQWNLDGQSPQFNYKVDKFRVNKVHVDTAGAQWNLTDQSAQLEQQSGTDWERQVHYDDAASLLVKYLWAVSNDLRGVGFWHIGYLDALENIPGGLAFRKRMWDLVPNSQNWNDYTSQALRLD